MTSVEEKIARISLKAAEHAIVEMHEWTAMQDLESPIEQLMFVALMCEGSWRTVAGMSGLLQPVYRDDGGDDVATLRQALAKAAQYQSHAIMFTPQARVGKYRVDFLLGTKRENADDALVAIECDGHDFHEKTKEQAARDKSRDRDLARMGITVMRFTGAEIWKDASACAGEVVKHMVDVSIRAWCDVHVPKAWGKISPLTATGDRDDHA